MTIVTDVDQRRHINNFHSKTTHLKAFFTHAQFHINMQYLHAAKTD